MFASLALSKKPSPFVFHKTSLPGSVITETNSKSPSQIVGFGISIIAVGEGRMSMVKSSVPGMHKPLASLVVTITVADPLAISFGPGV